GFNGEDDTLEGGLGNDDLNGLQGDDTYIYNLGDGSDTITEAFLGGSLDKLQLGAGITVASVTLAASSTDADDAVLTFSDGGTITLIKQLNTGSHYGVEEIIFADGTVWTKSDVIATIAGQSGGSSSTITHDGTAAGETINGTADDDVIRGQGGDDTLNGKQGNDTYLYSSGDGNDFLDDQDTSTTSVDILKLTDLTTADVTLSREGNDLIVTTIATGERIQVDDQFYSASYNYGVEQLQFVDGTIWDRDKMKLEAWYRGTDQAETINASTTDDTIDGGLGDDTLNGKAGNDTYVYSSGDGNDFLDDQDTSTTSVDILKLTDLNAADVTLSREGNDLFVMTIATGEKIQVDDQFYSANYNYGIEQIVFADGSILDRAQIKDAAWYRGTDQADTINASTTDDTLDGGLGDDTLNGKAGSDTYIYRSGDGNDFLDDQDISTTSVDILKLTDLNAADVTLSKLGNDLIVTTDANGQTIQLDDQFYSTNYNYGVEQIAFADGSTIDRDGIRQMVVDDQQTSGADQITGFSNQDDTFIFVGSDFGHDTVTDFEAGTSDGDVVEFDTNVFGAYADLLAAAADDGTDTTITIDADSSVVLKDVVIADLHQDDFRFV
ncbi:MAG: calcium-binding protein, partial [Stappiaceae bacterium]